MDARALVAVLEDGGGLWGGPVGGFGSQNMMASFGWDVLKIFKISHTESDVYIYIYTE